MKYDVIGISYSGEEALETARRHKPDLILMDIMVPGKLDGIAIAEIAKSELNIPVIFVTAFSEETIIERAKKAEPYGYILKPFQDHELKATIEVAFYKKEIEKKLQKAHEDLDRQVKERTVELYNALKAVEHSETELTQQKLALEKLSKELIETNQAVSVLAKNIDRKKQELEKKVYQICNGKLMPILKKLQKDVHCKKREADLELVINYLNEIIHETPLINNIGSHLTEQEMRVAMLIKKGLTSQQIADMLCISPNTVKTHRKNIRKKMKIDHKDINLVSYLKARLSSPATDENIS